MSAFRVPAFLCTALTTTAFLSLFSLTSAAQGADFGPLLQHVPDDANVIVLVNSDSLRASSFYKRVALEGEPLPGLEATNRILAASRWRLPTATSVYDVVVVDLKNRSAADAIAASRDGQALSLPPGSIAMALPSGMLGIFSPNDRQAASRWAKSSASPLTGYLTRGVGYAEQVGTQIVFAVDLTDALIASELEARIKAAPYNQTANIDPAAVAETLTRLKGCTLGVRMTDRANARWRFDFDGPIDAIKPAARKIMMTLVDRMGLSLPGMDQWASSIEGETLYLSGRLDAAGLRMLLSLLADAPSTVEMVETPGSTPNGTADPSAVKMATKQHFDSLNQLLRDVEHPKHSLVTAGSKAAYLDRYAKMIDRLPILQVDPDLVELSGEIAARLRVQAQRTRGNMIDAHTHLNNRMDTGYWDGNVYWVRTQGLTDEQLATRQARATSAKDGAEQKQEIMDAVAEMRRTLTVRYQMEF